MQAVPNHDPAGQNVETAIQEALQESKDSGIQGSDVTPFILRTVAEKTGGDSLRRCVLLLCERYDTSCVQSVSLNLVFDLGIFFGSLHYLQQHVSRKKKRRSWC